VQVEVGGGGGGVGTAPIGAPEPPPPPPPPPHDESMASTANAAPTRLYLIPESPSFYSFFNCLVDAPSYSRLYFAERRPARYGLLMAADSKTLPLFSYGTLRQANVQSATFGRLLEGRPDALAGYACAPMTITDPHVIAASGAAVHTIARPTGDPADRIEGIVFQVTAAELEAADRYESGPIRRIAVELVSGDEAFVYVSAEASG
jgi:gamma-glutamylcyclotransferase (GGCT)/AIG2-like uncharacterized protein YtfP